MSNYDDIFNSQPKQADTKSFSSFNKDEWAATKKQEREQAYALIDETAEAMTTDGEVLRSYLDVQSRFDRYSVGNALLITAQMPEANRLAGFEDWKKNNVYIKKGETGIIILEPGEEFTREDGSIGVSYNSKKVFDISQTTSKQRPASVVSYDPRLLLQALIHNAPCEIKISDQLPNGLAAAYVPEEKVIRIRQGMDAPDIFRSLAQELALAHMDKGNYKRNECAFTAYCASYVLCQRYGISTENFRFDRVPESLRGMDAKAIRGELGRIRDVSNDISASMSRVLEPQQRSQKNRDGSAR